MFRKVLKEIYSSDLISLEPDAIALDAVRLMRLHDVSCVVILEKGWPVGIFTERSIVQAASKLGPGFMDRPITEVMSSPVLSAEETTLIYEAYNLLAQRRIRHLVVVDQAGKALGVVTQSDLVTHLGFEYFVEVRKTGQIMTRTVTTLSPGASLTGALEIMAHRSISCLIVVEDDRPVGMISERDMARILLDQREIHDVSVADIMSTPVHAVDSDVSVHEASNVMRTKHVRRLVVTDNDGVIIGVVTQSDIVKGLEARYIEILREIIQEKDTRLQIVNQDLAEKTIYLDNILTSSVEMGIVAVDRQGIVNYCNPAAQAILGLDPDVTLKRSIREIHKSLGVDEFRFDRAMAAINTRTDRHSFEFTHPRTAGPRHIRARLSGIWDQNEKLIGHVLMVRDVTEQKAAEETIRHLAYHDMLTSLPNRTLFMDRLNQEIARADRNQSGLALMLLDLDRFKEINDTMGHHAGDEVLKQMALRLKSLLRDSDTVARVGGDEFMFLLPGVRDQQEASTVAEKILEALDRPLSVFDHELQMAGSLGMAFYPTDALTPEELMCLADQAMYQAKQKGRRNSRSNANLFAACPASAASTESV
ncbi:MAG: diguanylate cyclase domain-containing protein [Desulfonatronovibrio sp.]